MLCKDLARPHGHHGGYTRAVADMNDAPVWLINLREIVGSKRGDVTRVARAVPMKLSQLQRILSGDNLKPQINTLERIVQACDRSIEDLFSRPEGASGHGRREEGGGNPVLEERLAALDGKFPAEDSWRGDVQKAQSALIDVAAALARALRRPDKKSDIA